MGEKPLTKLFWDYFDLSLATSQELLNDVYRIRYDVYCTEFGYEKPNQAKHETDKYDALSQHCIVRHRSTGKPAGCVRLIEIPENHPQLILPFESVCAENLTSEELNPRRLPPRSLCELSRLAVHPAFRKRTGEKESIVGYLGDTSLSEMELRLIPIITIALFLAASSLVVQTGRYNVFAMMEPRLARLLQRSGFRFTCVSETIEHRGTRAAFHIATEDGLKQMNQDILELFNTIDESIAPAMGETVIDPSRKPIPF